LKKSSYEVGNSTGSWTNFDFGIFSSQAKSMHNKLRSRFTSRQRRVMVEATTGKGTHSLPVRKKYKIMMSVLDTGGKHLLKHIHLPWPGAERMIKQ
jgi:hypothetical protein